MDTHVKSANIFDVAMGLQGTPGLPPRQPEYRYYLCSQQHETRLPYTVCYPYTKERATNQVPAWLPEFVDKFYLSVVLKSNVTCIPPRKSYTPEN